MGTEAQKVGQGKKYAQAPWIEDAKAGYEPKAEKLPSLCLPLPHAQALFLCSRWKGLPLALKKLAWA